MVKKYLVKWTHLDYGIGVNREKEEQMFIDKHYAIEFYCKTKRDNNNEDVRIFEELEI